MGQARVHLCTAAAEVPIESALHDFMWRCLLCIHAARTVAVQILPHGLVQRTRPAIRWIWIDFHYNLLVWWRL